MNQNLLFRETTIAAGQTCPTTETFNSFGGFRPGGFRPGGFRPWGFGPWGFGLTEESDRHQGQGGRNVCVRSKLLSNFHSNSESQIFALYSS